MSPIRTLERVFLDCVDIETELHRLADEEAGPARRRELELVAARVRQVGESAMEPAP